MMKAKSAMGVFPLREEFEPFDKVIISIKLGSKVHQFLRLLKILTFTF